MNSAPLNDSHRGGAAPGATLIMVYLGNLKKMLLLSALRLLKGRPKLKILGRFNSSLERTETHTYGLTG